MDAEEVYELRQKKALPVVEEFKQWLDKRMQSIYTAQRVAWQGDRDTINRWDKKYI